MADFASANGLGKGDVQQKTASIFSVVVPSFNERDNIAPLVEKLEKALAGITWELIVVDDDSPDGTAEVVKALAREHPHIHCIHRIGRHGLSSACIEGIASSEAPYVAVMDADHQHDETILPQMLARAEAGDQIVIGSRYVAGGSAGDGLSPIREWGSRSANWVSRLMSGFRTSDPMSGFFLVRRSLFEEIAEKLAPEGFKILLDILLTAGRRHRDLKVSDVPYTFRKRLSGESKMSLLIVAQLIGLWGSRLTGGFLPVTFVLFALVGLSGVFVHLGTLTVAFKLAGLDFTVSQLVATLVAMTSNFILNNEFTYADRRLRGWRFLAGMLSFFAICSVGALANMSLATMIYSVRPGIYVAGLVGALVGAVFNYAVTRIFTWRRVA
jgi:dolichol-phosphate mannosyltransferase